MEASQHSPDSSSEECTVLEAPPTKNTCLQHAGKVCTTHYQGPEPGASRTRDGWTGNNICQRRREEGGQEGGQQG